MSGTTTGKFVEPIDYHIGYRLRTRRTMVGRSRQWLAEQLRITVQQLEKLEKGVNRLHANKLYRAGQVLEIHPGWFFEGFRQGTEEVGAFNPDEAATQELSRANLRALADMSGLPPMKQTMVREVIKGLLAAEELDAMRAAQDQRGAKAAKATTSAH